MLEQIFEGSELGLERGTVRLAPSKRSWPATFHRLAAWMMPALPTSVVTLEHIGSTAVPGLPAKPILDVAVGAMPDADSEEITSALVGLGFILRGDGDPGTLDRNFGLELRPRHRLVNAHLVTYDGAEWSSYLNFRDRLRADSHARDNYAALKVKLAQQHVSDRPAYVAGKDSFVADLLSSAN